MQSWLSRTIPIGFSKDVFMHDSDPEALSQAIMDRIEEAYRIKEQIEGEESLRWLERYIMLNALDNLYQEHLYAMDSLRQGVQLRSYGQRDPLVEYKQEAYKLFSDLMDAIKDDICSNIFRFSSMTQAQAEALLVRNARERGDGKGSSMVEIHQSLSAFEGLDGNAAGRSDAAAAGPHTVRREQPKVGRNDPCPCGSGKKFKACHGR